eukprot:TRINITY_DN27139_c0_g1_i2.p1 TRINITY_DN27139_c0_g1~~TRINITY_DN27139_c0_g1_i2.p1  ORF type:complete len:800 (+),score=84.26 TRINITY_DN27139_c0_g1_i2:106-2505(+)
MGRFTSENNPVKRRKIAVEGDASKAALAAGLEAALSEQDKLDHPTGCSLGPAAAYNVQQIQKDWESYAERAKLTAAPTLVDVKRFLSEHLVTQDRRNHQLVAQTSLRKRADWLFSAVFPKLFPAEHKAKEFEEMATVARQHVKWIYSADGQKTFGRTGGAIVQQALREATGPRTTRQHATTGDLQILHDHLLTEGLQVNKALTIDAFLAVTEATAMRPSSLLNNRFDDADLDALTPLSALIVGSCLNKGEGRNGGTITYVLEARCNKGQRHRNYTHGVNILPNAETVLHMSTTRLTRYLLKRGAFEGCYTNNEEELWRRVNEPSFTGLTPEDCGFEHWSGVAESCASKKWALYAPAQKEWALFAALTADGAFHQRESARSERLARAVQHLGLDAGFDAKRFGLWSIRKMVCENLVRAGRDEQASRVLQHKSISSESKNKIYKADLHDVDLAFSAVPGSEPGICEAELSLASLRVKASRICCERDVPEDSEEWAKHLRNPKTAQLEREAGAALQAVVAIYQAALKDVRNPDYSGGSMSEASRNKRKRELLEGSKKAADASYDVCRGTVSSVFLKHSLPNYCSAVRSLPAAEIIALAKKFRPAWKKYVSCKQKLDKHRHQAAGVALEAVRREVWLNAQAFLRRSPDARAENRRALSWPDMTELQAVVFSLDRPDFSHEKKLLQGYTPAIRTALLDTGAVHLVRDRKDVMEDFYLLCPRCDKTTDGGRKVFHAGQFQHCPCGGSKLKLQVRLKDALSAGQFQHVSLYNDQLLRPVPHLWHVWRQVLRMDEQALNIGFPVAQL